MAAKKKAVRKGGKTIGEKVLAALAKFGQATSDRLARRVGAPTSTVSSACSRLHKAGKLKRVDKTSAGRGGEAIWALGKAR